MCWLSNSINCMSFLRNANLTDRLMHWISILFFFASTNFFLYVKSVFSFCLLNSTFWTCKKETQRYRRPTTIQIEKEKTWQQMTAKKKFFTLSKSWLAWAMAKHHTHNHHRKNRHKNKLHLYAHAIRTIYTGFLRFVHICVRWLFRIPIARIKFDENPKNNKIHKRKFIHLNVKFENIWHISLSFFLSFSSLY